MSEHKNDLEYIVWELAETLSVSTEGDLKRLNALIARIQAKREELGKKPKTSYIVVSEDEPYFQLVGEYVQLMKKQFGGQNNANSQ
jgi:hypothetical protein